MQANQSKRKEPKYVFIHTCTHVHAHTETHPEQVHTDKRSDVNKRLGVNVVMPEKAKEGNMISYGPLI